MGILTTKRPSLDEYFMDITNLVKERSTCNRAHVGVVVVKDKRIISTGYNGAPQGMPHCTEVGCNITKVKHPQSEHIEDHCTRTLHAEQNAIAQAARFGIALDGATLYCKMVLCSTCAKMAITAGIKRVVAEKDYHASARTKKMFQKAGIQLEIVNKEVEKYARQ